MDNWLIRQFNKDNRFISLSILTCYPVVGILMYLAISGMVKPFTSALLCGVVAILPMIVLVAHFIRTGNVL